MSYSHRFERQHEAKRCHIDAVLLNGEIVTRSAGNVGDLEPEACPEYPKGSKRTHRVTPLNFDEISVGDFMEG
jgi:hypothetical protein